MRDATVRARSGRSATLHALHVVEYALAAPTPRRQRTWLHRVGMAVDALAAALDEQIHAADESAGLLTPTALSAPRYAAELAALRAERSDLRIAVASIVELIEEQPELPIETAEIRDRLAAIAARYRRYCSREADVVYEATGIDLNVEARNVEAHNAEARNVEGLDAEARTGEG